MRKTTTKKPRHETTAEIVPIHADDVGYADHVLSQTEPLKPGEEEYTDLGCALVVAARLLRRRALRLYESMDAIGCEGTSVLENEATLREAAGLDSYADVLMRQYVRMQRSIYPQREDWQASPAEAQPEGGR